MGQAQNQIFEGMDVYDWEGMKIGKVTSTTRSSAISRPRGPHLAAAKDSIMNHFVNVPAALETLTRVQGGARHV